MIIMTTPPIPAGIVTTTDLYLEVTATRREVAAVKGAVDVIDARYQAITVQVSDHENRLRLQEGKVPDNLAARLAGVERWQWRASAVVASVATLAGLLSGYLGFLLGHIH